MNPYKILGIDETATDEEVKRAYRRMATKYHPDAGGDAWAFEQVRSAYDSIMEDRSRSNQYPSTKTAGEDSPKPTEKQQQPHAGSKHTDSRRNDSTRSNSSHSESAQSNTRRTSTHSQQSNAQKSQTNQSSRTHKTAQSNSSSTSNPYTNPIGQERKRPAAGNASDAQQQSSPIKYDGFSLGDLFRVSFKQKLPLQTETCIFILVNVLDIVMTNILLRTHGIESNPLARFFLHHWGFRGLIAFKMAIVAFVCLIAQLIAQRHLTRARQLLYLGSAIVGIVVVYSFMLILQ